MVYQFIKDLKCALLIIIVSLLCACMVKTNSPISSTDDQGQNQEALFPLTLLYTGNLRGEIEPSG